VASPLAGSLALTIGKAFNNIFLPATLTRGANVYPCRAIFEKWSEYSGANYVLTSNDYTILVLASTLAVQPQRGDIITLEGFSAIVSSNTKAGAVSTDPAFAVWTLLCLPAEITTSGLTGDWPRTISITRPAEITPNAPPTGGIQPYQGETKAGETSVVSGIACAILIASAGRTKLGEGLPDDSPKVQWLIEIPTNGIVNLPMIWEGDRIYDDLGRQFEVSAYEPEALSAKLTAVRIRA
jgi:hypothetical protein